MTSSRRFRPPWKSWAVVALTLTLAAGGLSAAQAATPPAHQVARPAAEVRHHPRPTVVLVHGAWADSSSWDGVIARLLDHGYPVDVFPTPLRSLAGDSTALRTYLAAIQGPVVLVGHSYGGAVVTDAATGNENIKALVYLDAFAPAEGETVLQLASATSVLANPDPTKVFSFIPDALPPSASTDFYVLDSFFPSAFAGDIPARKAAVLAATQRPVTFGALNEQSTAPAWKTIPSWYEVGTIDRVIPPSQQLLMARRAHSHIVQVCTSHLPMISQPAAVDRLIESAATATS